MFQRFSLWIECQVPSVAAHAALLRAATRPEASSMSASYQKLEMRRNDASWPKFWKLTVVISCDFNTLKTHLVWIDWTFHFCRSFSSLWADGAQVQLPAPWILSFPAWCDLPFPFPRKDTRRSAETRWNALQVISTIAGLAVASGLSQASSVRRVLYCAVCTFWGQKWAGVKMSQKTAPSRVGTKGTDLRVSEASEPSNAL